MKPRQLLVLDEGHLFEKEIVEYASLSISNKRWKRYIPDLNVNDLHLDCDEIKEWLPLLIDIETKLLLALGFTLEIEEFARDIGLLDIYLKIEYIFLGDESESEKSITNSAITGIIRDVTPKPKINKNEKRPKL